MRAVDDTPSASELAPVLSAYRRFVEGVVQVRDGEIRRIETREHVLRDPIGC